MCAHPGRGLVRQPDVQEVGRNPTGRTGSPIVGVLQPLEQGTRRSLGTMTVSRWRSWLALGILIALTMASAVWSVSTSPRAPARQAILTPPSTTSNFRSPPSTSPPSTSPSGVMNPTVATTIIDPSTYRPNYDTIASLAADSGQVFIGTARPLSQDPTDGGTVASFTVNQSLLGLPMDTLPYPEIPEGQSGDVPVVVGQEYLVFWSPGNGENETSCVVGGTRGLFTYIAATQTVRRVATSPSQIPTTLTVSQVIAQLPNPNVSLPEVEPPPPVCSASVTGS
jgi:hypothetical protein